MYKLDSQKKWVSFILSFLLIFSLAASIMLETVPAESASPYQEIITDPSGRHLIQAIFPVAPPKIRAASVDMPEVCIAGVTNTLSSVPAFDWSYGCVATSAAMLFGYYDRIGYGNMYTGTANSGVCPLDNSIWGHTNWPSVSCGECPLSASHNGIDSRAIRGHVDDYWVDYGRTGPDPYVSNGWVEHTSDCTGDYMGTNQAKYGNADGSTMFYFCPNGDPLYDYTGAEPTYRDGCHGMRLFAQSRGYTVITNFTQLIKGQGSDASKGFTFADFQAEIDAGRPVLILVTGHAMLGYGYDTRTNTIYVHNAWDYYSHTMTWGGTYSGMQHLGVAVIRLNPPSLTAPSNLTATSISSSQINLTWQDNSSDETGFRIERKTGSGSYSQIATLGANAASYSDTFLSAGTTYYYRVRTYNVVANSDYSNEASATTCQSRTVECVAAGTFNSERYQPGEWDYAINITRTEAGDFVSGTIELTAPDASKVVGVVKAVKCNYALWYANPLVSKPNFAAVGTATYGAWTGNFMFLLADSHIWMALSTDDYSDKWAAGTVWASGARAYDIWSDDGGFWVDCLCPTVECEAAGTFTSQRYQPGTWSYDISITRAEEDGKFVSGTIELTAPDESKVVGVAKAVECNYACWYNSPVVSKPNFAAVGTATYGNWQGNFMFLLADSHIWMALSTDDCSDEWAAETVWARGLRAYDIWADDGGFWVDCLCPTVDCVAAGTFNSERYQPGEWDYAINITRDQDGDFVSGTIELTAPDEGEVVALIEAVKCNYALWYTNPLVSKPNFAAVGTATYGAWQGNFMFLLADSHIWMALSTDDYSDEWAAETVWARGLRAYDIWADDGGFWVGCLCPDVG